MEDCTGDREKSKGKERLLKAAQHLAQNRPFDEITIEDIIKEARLSRPAFYYHFSGGKEELRALLVKRGLLPSAPTQDIRRAILEAALRIFARSGTFAATLDEIAAEAGVSRGTLCWHFHTKDELLTGIIKHYGPHSMLRSVIDQIEQELDSGAEPDEETIFRRVAGAFYDGFAAQGDYTRLAILLIYTHPQIAKTLADKIVKGRKKIIEYVQKRQQEGYIRQDIHPAFIVHILVMSFAMRAIGRDLNDLMPFGHLSRDEMIDQLVKLLLYGIVVQGPQAEHREQSS
ncbi:MAG TPA: TetR/AcrR family transcriptional regulator [Ktedonobacteraceae bacterium]|jgi:AcrR family transcriptional regulator|nr:TetR/AcrR family transcriptional regulator [Ktedonobacteraceae bacterium]